MRVSVSNLKGLRRFGEASCGPDACLNCLSLHNWAGCFARKENLVRQQAIPGSAWARVTARTEVLVLALAWLFPSRPRESKRCVKAKSSSELNKTVLVHISAEEVQLVPLSSRANCPRYACVRVSAGVCVLSNRIHLTKFCGVLLHLNEANGT